MNSKTVIYWAIGLPVALVLIGLCICAVCYAWAYARFKLRSNKE